MRARTKRTAGFSAAIAVVALIGAGCTHGTKEKAGQTASSVTSSTTSAIAAGPSATAPSSTQIAGANGMEYTVEGPILAKYESLNDAARKSLGAPTGNEQKNPDGGVFQQFDGGVIVHTTRSYSYGARSATSGTSWAVRGASSVIRPVTRQTPPGW